MSRTTIEVIRCDVCGAEPRADEAVIWALPATWAHVEEYRAGSTQPLRTDLCPACAFYVADAIRRRRVAVREEVPQ